MTQRSHGGAKAELGRIRGAARHSVQDSRKKRTWREYGQKDQTQTSPRGAKGPKTQKGEERGGKGRKGEKLQSKGIVHEL